MAIVTNPDGLTREIRYHKENYKKLESIIRIGRSPSTLADFPTPSSLGYTLADVDLDAFTDLRGYTHRNRVRHDVLSLELGYNLLSDEDTAFILNAISDAWVYVEIQDKKTLQRSVHRMYASDKQFNVFRFFKDENGNYNEIDQEFSVTLVEE